MTSGIVSRYHECACPKREQSAPDEVWTCDDCGDQWVFETKVLIPTFEDSATGAMVQHDQEAKTIRGWYRVPPSLAPVEVDEA